LNIGSANGLQVKFAMILLNSTSEDAGPLDSASVLACAYQLKVRSKNPTDFEYWFCQRLTSKIRNDFIKQHQRGRWRYLALFAPICWRTLPSVCLISLKNTSKTHRTLFTFYGTRWETRASVSVKHKKCGENFQRF